MRTFFRTQGCKVQSDDGVVVDPFFGHELASYECNGERWMVPCECWDRKDGTAVRGLYINRGAVYKKGAFGVPVDEAMLSQLREDMLSAFAAAGIEAELHQFQS